MDNTDKQLLLDTKDFIEKAMGFIDWNSWEGYYRTTKELIEEHAMPEVYYSICDRLKEME